MSDDAQDVVLIVEDEPVIMRVLTDYLSGLGYRVLQAENSDEAFDILATKPNLDVIVTDYRLPNGVSGVAIVDAAIKLRPDLKVIFISGYPQEIRECDSTLARTATILAKPFDLEILQDEIQRLLA
ncbi:Sporulation initiation phosphotransferase F [compost metagenome]